MQRMLFHFWHPGGRGTERGKLGSKGGWGMGGGRERMNMNAYCNKNEANENKGRN